MFNFLRRDRRTRPSPGSTSTLRLRGGGGCISKEHIANDPMSDRYKNGGSGPDRSRHVVTDPLSDRFKNQPKDDLPPYSQYPQANVPQSEGPSTNGVPSSSGRYSPHMTGPQTMAGVMTAGVNGNFFGSA